MKGKNKKEKRRSVLAMGLVALVIVGLGVLGYLLWRGQPVASTYQNKPTPTPSPGHPGNLGDVAKSQIGQQVMPTPTSSASGITIQQFSPEPRPGGRVQVSSQLSGASSGDCSLALSGPSGMPLTFSGQIAWSGTYYFCSFDSITGANQAGVWHATLTATSDGKISSSASTTFKVTGS